MSHLAVVRKALDAIAAGDLAGVLQCLTDDVVFEFPYADDGTVLDKAGVERTIGTIIKTFSRRSFEILEVHELATEDGLIVEYRSKFRSAVGAVDYTNRYVAVLGFRDGQVALWREYADPVPFNRALADIRAAAGSH